MVGVPFDLTYQHQAGQRQSGAIALLAAASRIKVMAPGVSD
jgi:hypothetical protein